MALTRPVLMMSSSARTIPVHSTGSVSTPCAHKSQSKNKAYLDITYANTARVHLSRQLQVATTWL
jgi:hypothetical protein